MEYLFILSTASLLIVLPIVQVYRKDYILGIESKNAALTASNWLALFIFLDLITLKALPLLSKCAVMAFLLYDFDFEIVEVLRNSTLLRPVLKFKRQIASRKFLFALRLSLTLALIVFDYIYLGLHKLDNVTQAKYWTAIFVVVFNALYVFQYKAKTLIENFIDREDEMIKVKWLSHMILAFYAPIFVFLFNTTPNYSILRFNKDFTVIVLLGIATVIHFGFSTFRHSSKIDVNCTNLKRQSSGYIILGVCAASYLVLNTSQGWILDSHE